MFSIIDKKKKVLVLLLENVNKKDNLLLLQGIYLLFIYLECNLLNSSWINKHIIEYYIATKVVLLTHVVTKMYLHPWIDHKTILLIILNQLLILNPFFYIVVLSKENKDTFKDKPDLFLYPAAVLVQTAERVGWRSYISRLNYVWARMYVLPVTIPAVGQWKDWALYCEISWSSDWRGWYSS